MIKIHWLPGYKDYNKYLYYSSLFLPQVSFYEILEDVLPGPYHSDSEVCEDISLWNVLVSYI
jgi:hypothetical protein